MAAKRYFEFIEGTSSKFWEIWREGAQVYTRYGKIGANGQVTVKDEGTEDKAQKLYDKLVREKTGKGYEEKAAAGGAPASAPAPAKAAEKAPEKVPEKAPEKVAEKAPAKPAPAPAPVAAAPAAAAFVPAGTRRFEFSEGGSNKFWEITVDGNAHTVRYGKIGTPGQEKTKSFGSEAAAQADADKLIAEKTKKGYTEVSGGGGGGDAGPPAPELDPKELAAQLAAIDADPTNPDVYLVFADWLQGKGHPWGTLIAIQHGIETATSSAKKVELAKEEQKLLQSQGAAILGELARAGRPTRFTWHYGFITEAIIASPTDKIVLKERVETLFKLPAARGIEKLTLHAQPARFEPHQDWDTSMDDVVDPWKEVVPALAGAPKSLKALAFGDPPPTAASGYVRTPDLGKLAKALPGLESLEIQGLGGQGALGRFNFPSLKSLDLRLSHTNAADLDAVAEGKLPALERLSVWLGGSAYCILDDVYEPKEWDEDDEDANRYPDSYPTTDLEKMEVHEVNTDLAPAQVRSFLDGKWPASLKHLGLNSASLTTEMVEAICEGKLIKQLETLDLSGGNLNDERAKVLISHKAKLAHLKELNLARNGLTKTGASAVEAAIKGAKIGKQRDDSYAPEFIFRYVATME
jgi:uncharacterized protein (TIGR02996 family)